MRAGAAGRGLGARAPALGEVKQVKRIEPGLHAGNSSPDTSRMGESEIAVAHAQLSARQLAQGEHIPALENMATALRLAPGLTPLWAQFSDLVRYFNFRHPADPVRDLLARALEHPAVDPGNLVRPISSIALSHPQGPLAEPLLLRLMEDAVIRDLSLEQTITESRRRLPHELPLVAALAHQCFNTEYVFDETSQPGKPPRSLAEYVAYACHRALWTLEDPAAAAAAIEASPFAKLAHRQIREPLEERRLANEIPALSGATSAVSAAVQAQYEANPYPRWLRAQAWAEAMPLGSVQNILIAGCGTGQHAIATALRFPAAHVLAVDLSLASLAYAKRKTSELGVRNIEYRQADILAMDALPERFDLIECSGVLHHLEDPFAGWRILAGLRKPGARMRIGLYSELGRRAVVRARELIAAEGWGPDPEGIRACRAAIRARAHDELFQKIIRNEDFYSMSGCRDLLFHVQEHRFTLPQVGSMIERLGLSFLGFELADSGSTMSRYRARYEDALNLADWDRFEREFPDTFSRMYQFWVD
jgi:SAM-dependent methyltransferase